MTDCQLTRGRKKEQTSSTHGDVELGRLGVEGEIERAVGSGLGREDLTKPGADRIATGSVAAGEGLEDGEVGGAGPAR